MQRFTVRQYLTHYNNEYNSRRILKALTELLPSSNDGHHPFSVINDTFYANFDALVLVPYVASHN